MGILICNLVLSSKSKAVLISTSKVVSWRFSRSAASQEAHAAGVAAAREFVKRAEIDKDGFVRDTFGRASLKVGDRSGDVRSALKRLDPDAVWEGYWWILGFKDQDMPAPACQSIRAHETACEAARIVMKAHSLKKTMGPSRSSPWPAASR
jgi:hypothetical protein